MSYENESSIPFFNEGGKRKTKMEGRIPFFNEGGKRKTKMEGRIPFFSEGGKRKTKMEVQIPFSHVAGKRLALRYTHCKPLSIRFLKVINSNFTFQRHNLLKSPQI